MINRRVMLWTMGLSALLVRNSAIAQQHTWRVGFLALPKRPEPFQSSRFGSFVRGMRDLGYVEGRNLEIEWRFADNEVARLAGLATELVNLKVDLIVASGTPVISAAQKATATIPIVMPTSNDPVGSGFVTSLGRPGGNITGLSNLSSDYGAQHEQYYVSEIYAGSYGGALLPSGGFDCCERRSRRVRAATRKGPKRADGFYCCHR
jgi:putative ABC transport system substrate-binding protein